MQNLQTIASAILNHLPQELRSSLQPLLGALLVAIDKQSKISGIDLTGSAINTIDTIVGRDSIGMQIHINITDAIKDILQPIQPRVIKHYADIDDPIELLKALGTHSPKLIPQLLDVLNHTQPTPPQEGHILIAYEPDHTNGTVNLLHAFHPMEFSETEILGNSIGCEPDAITTQVEQIVRCYVKKHGNLVTGIEFFVPKDYIYQASFELFPYPDKDFFPERMLLHSFTVVLRSLERLLPTYGDEGRIRKWKEKWQHLQQSTPNALHWLIEIDQNLQFDIAFAQSVAALGITQTLLPDHVAQLMSRVLSAGLPCVFWPRTGEYHRLSEAIEYQHLSSLPGSIKDARLKHVAHLTFIWENPERRPKLPHKAKATRDVNRR